MSETQFFVKCAFKPLYDINSPELVHDMALIVSAVRSMDGCLSIDVLEVPEKPCNFYFCSRWVSREQFDAHLSPDYVKVLAVFKDKYLTSIEPVVTQLVSI